MLDLLEFYQAMPYPLRVFATSLRGSYLNWWRYGSDTEKIVAEAQSREFWSETQWQIWQEERLVRILHQAATTVPFYRDYWRSRKLKGDHSSWERLENWPVLKKTALRKNPKAFISEDYKIWKLYEEHTSGSTGTPVHLWLSRDCLHHWYGLFEARWRRWHRINREDRWAIVGGQRIVPYERSTPPFWVWNAGMNQLYLSSLHIRPDFLEYYLDAIQKHSISYLLGYTSGLYWLAVQANKMHVQIPMRVVLTNAEPVYSWQRSVIEKAFDCPVRETYGQVEMVGGGGECEHGGLHLWPDAGYNELLDENDQPVPKGEPGRFIGTSLLNDAMPLIRYDSTDMLTLSKSTSCKCGRTLPLIDKILGRYDDFIVTPDGRRVLLIDIIFSPTMHVYEAQIVQEAIDQITVRVVPTSDWDEEHDKDLISSAIRQRMGNVKITVLCVPEIERTWAGKFKVMVSKLANSTPTIQK